MIVPYVRDFEHDELAQFNLGADIFKINVHVPCVSSVFCARVCKHI